MTLVSSILTDAYRESNMLPLGKAMTDNQATEALRLYNALLQSIYGGAAGEQLNDWPLGTFSVDAPQTDLTYELPSWVTTPPGNNRLIVLNTAPITVFLPGIPQDGMRFGISDPFARLQSFPVTLDANGRTIQGTATLLLNTSGFSGHWIYRSDLASWLSISAIGLTDTNPFPSKFDAMFIILLSIRLNPRYGRSIDEQSAAVLKEQRTEFVARYLQSAPLEGGDDLSWPFMSRQSFYRGRSFSSTQAFNRGDWG